MLAHGACTRIGFNDEGVSLVKPAVSRIARGADVVQMAVYFLWRVDRRDRTILGIDESVRVKTYRKDGF